MSITRSERSDAGKIIVAELVGIRQEESVFTGFLPQQCPLG